MESRIIEVEKRIAFLEHNCDELNAALLDHQKLLMEHKTQIEFLKDRSSHESLVKSQDEEEPPPHY